MPTLQRYKRLHKDRISSVGTGRRQRYPESAVAAVQALKSEGLRQRGRRRPSAAAAARKSATRGGAAKRDRQQADDLLSLSDVAKATGISYPTLVRYVRLHSDRLPQVGEGRKRRFRPEAVQVFLELRQRRRRNGKAAARHARTAKKASRDDGALLERIERLERSQAEVERKFKGLVATLETLVV